MTLMQNHVRIVRPSQGICAIYITHVTRETISMQEKCIVTFKCQNNFCNLIRLSNVFTKNKKRDLRYVCTSRLFHIKKYIL